MKNSSSNNLNNRAAQLAAEDLATTLNALGDQKVVLAESCTSGLVAAALGSVAGISRFFCGSAVTYRESCKTNWLDVDSKTLEKFTPESQETTNEMCVAALDSIPEATWSAAITGHLGRQTVAPTETISNDSAPNDSAPEPVDGIVFVAVAVKAFESETATHPTCLIVAEAKKRLVSNTRIDRQSEAAVFLLKSLTEQIRLMEELDSYPT